MDENITISNQDRLNKLKANFKQGGKDNIHILADFDKTLTKAYFNGEKMPSVISILRKSNYLTPEYAEDANKLFEQYHPIEIDLEMPFEEKKTKMTEWWQKHFQLLIKAGLNKNDIAKVIEDPRIKFRQEAIKFLQSLNDLMIPLVIISSAGLGAESISLLLDKNDCHFENIKIISNEFEYDEKGNAIKVKQPIIHVLNKDETVINNYPEIFNKIKERKNVILIGDNLEDINMINGFDYDNLIKIGFLNDQIKKNIEAYKKNYDIIITNDSDMECVNKLLKDII